MKFTPSGDNTADYAVKLLAYNGNVNGLTQASVNIGTNDYLLSDKVQVFRKQDTKYFELSLNELISELDSYKVTCYYDKTEDVGGRVRVIIAESK